ncbi:MAG TPA: PDZ domain-containing protein, partial [Pirellulales bacterium]|nr:PDZ domain-containing protein [Pirellulales bacterium]
MQSATWLRRASWLGVFGIALLSVKSARADDDKSADEKSPPAKEETLTKEEIARKSVSRPRTAKYWLEMQVVSVSPALSQQLDLKGEGVLVAHVRPDGPADKGGIKENDVLLTIGDKSIKDLTDVVTALNASDGKELSVKLMRSGKTMSVSVTPVERVRKDKDFWPEAHPFGDVDIRDMEKSIREKLKQAGVDVRMQLIQPGKIFPKQAGLSFNMPEFPDDVTVNIHKEGKKPADIEVKRGDKTWNVKEGDLAALPEDLREPIEMLLGRNSRALMLRLANPFAGPHPPGPPHAEGPGTDGPDHGPGDRPPRAEDPGRGPGRRPPRPGGPDGGPDGRRPPRPDDGPDHGPGDRPPRPDGLEGPDHRPPGPPRADGGPPD